MIYRFLFVLLILFAAGCVEPVLDTPTPSPSPSPTPSNTPTETVTPLSTWTATLTETATPSPTATFTSTPSVTPSATSSPTRTLTPTITQTPAPTWTADQVNMFFSPAITVTFDPTNPAQHCFLTFYDSTLEPGFWGVWRRDKGGYLNCVKGG